MATLYVSEFPEIALAVNAPTPMARQPAIVEQAVSIGANSAPSAAFNVRTKMVRLHTDVICSVTFGTAPVATAAMARMAAGQTEYFAVQPGDKVAVITNT